MFRQFVLISLLSLTPLLAQAFGVCSAQLDPFNFELFQQHKKRFAAQAQLSPPSESFESKLAFIEVSSQRNHRDLLLVGEALKDSDHKDHKHIQQILKKFNPQAKLSDWQSQQLILELYKFVNKPQKPRLRNFFKNHSANTKLQQRLEQAFLQHNFSEALEELGFIRNDSMRDKWQRFKLRHHIKLKSVTAGLINYLSVQLFAFPLYFPKMHPVKTLEPPISVIKDLEHINSSDFYLNHQASFETKKWAHIFWRDTRRTFYAGIVGFFAYSFWLSGMSLPDWQEFKAGFAMAGNAKAVASESYEVPNEPDLANGLLKPYYEAWRESFIKRNGREPNLDKESDRAQWNDVASRALRYINENQKT